MDSTALLSVVGGAFLLSIILVASLCTYCWGHKQPTSIHQRPSDSEYHPASSFGLRHPVSTYAPHTDHARIGPYPHPNSPNTTIIQKVPSCPPSETGSQASYVNQKESEDEPCDPPLSEYIVVLPDLPMPHSQSRAPSRASSLSSGDQYINVKDEKDDNVPEVIFDYVMHTDESDSDIPDYENYQNSPGHRKESYSLSRGSQSSDERDSSDYVNTDPNLQ
ncbi:linker for activation of T-cells family member 1 isoform X2 [Labeo rohita]|uniref:linker for activation of T-cells family member 1 isoform X2 n=1 Tax=Labeo rohita TaxID=84645 RepID=UPI0021E2A0DE|nr:linker for activation of T-cells family member 1 isoform X2 [Labeo rohita]